MRVGDRGAKERGRGPVGGMRPRLTRPVRGSLVRIRQVTGKVQVSLPRLPLSNDRIGKANFQRVEGLSPEAALHAGRNFRFGVLNGIMFTLMDAFIAPSLVLAWFVNRLGAPNTIVGLLPAILSGGWLLPQLLVASRVQGLSSMMPWYRRTGQVRVVCLACLTVSTVLLAAQPVLLLAVFFVFYVIYAFAAGVSGIPWIEMVGKVIAPRRRGSFFGQRSFWGGVLALIVAGPIGAVLSEQLWGLTFPYNFALLFGVGTVIVAVGVWGWTSVKEPPASMSAPQLSVRQLIRRGREALRADRDYRSFTTIRVLISLATIADPFYVVFAKNALDAPPASVGLYLGAVSLSSLLSNFFWSPLSDRASNRTLMVWTVAAVGVVPLTALLIAFLSGLVDPTLLFSAFALVFVLSGLALGAARIVNNNMLLTIAPPGERATYVGFLNTILGVVIFVPVIGGLIVDEYGFYPLFVLPVLLSGLAMLATRQMSRERTVN